MANPYYTPTGYPATGASGSSASMRSEMALVEDGFDLLPTLSGNGGKHVTVNAGGTALVASGVVSESGSTLTVAGNLSVTGTTSLTSPLPAASGGTGQSSYTAGDLLYASGTTALSKLGVGTANQVLTSSGTAPQWSSGLTLTTLTTSSTVTLNAGTANGVAYLNASKVLTTGTALTFDGTGVQRITASAGAFQLYKDSTPTKAARFALNTVATDAAELSVYNGSAWADSFYVSPSNFAAWILNSVERMRLDSSGNLGVGTNNPAAPLDITKTGVQFGTTTAYLIARTRESGATKGVSLGYDSGSQTGIVMGDTASGSSNLAFWTFESGGSGWAERMRLDSSGNLGVGTSSPAQRLDVTGVQNSVQARFGNVAGRGLTIGTSLISGTNDAGVVFNAPTATDGTLIFQTGGNERARITGGGDVGIGTNAPSQKLDVNGSVQLQATGVLYFNNVDNTNQYYFQNIGGSGANNAVLTLSRTNAGETLRVDASGNLGIGTAGQTARGNLDISSAGLGGSQTRTLHFGYSAVDFYGWRIANTNNAANTAAGTLSFQRGTTLAWADAVTLTDSGNLGVGTTSPSYKLDVHDPTAGVIRAFTTSTGNAGLVAQTAAGGTAYLELTTNAGSNYIYGGAGGTQNLSFVVGSERARIDSDGNLLVGTTSQFATDCKFTVKNATVATPAGAFWNATTTGDATFVGFSTEASPNTRGTITYNRAGGLVAYNTTSDYRAKDILGPVADPGDVIDSLKVYTGKMKGATVERPMLVAHEAQAVAPYAVTGEKDAVNEDGTPKFQQMDVSSLVPLLIAEIQTLRARVAALEAQ